MESNSDSSKTDTKAAGAGAGVTEFVLHEDTELRFEVSEGQTVSVDLIDGTAEIFGTELLINKRYEFSEGSRVAVFTWHGCKLELRGDSRSAYTAEKTPMVIYLNTHAALEQLRRHAESSKESDVRGPRLMIVGPTDVGKSTYCRLLLNYAIRQGRSPTLIDLDVGQGSISAPGTVAALRIERTADPAEGFDKKAPLVYYFGHLSPGANIPLYNLLVSQLASVITRRCMLDREANLGGVIINTCGWVKGAGYTCIRNAAEAFEVDVVVVLDHERLYNELQRDLPRFVKIVHQPKSGGVEERSREMRIAARQTKIRNYFYGTPNNALYPYTFELRFEEIELLKVGAAQLPDSCMPIGTEQDDHRTKLVTHPITPNIRHHLLGLSMCQTVEEEVLKSNVAGFVVVTDVDMDKQLLTVLSPQPYPLPRNILIYGDITFVET